MSEQSPELLLHSCCGPCLEWPARDLLQSGTPFMAWFYNPNIHPAVEYDRRLAGFLSVVEVLGLSAEVDDGPYDLKPWIRLGGAKNPERCRMCYRIRLEKAARRAVELGCPAFSSTLLVSPWQNREAICAAGREAGERFGVVFCEYDWRTHYREGQALAKEHGIYRQRYCGCLPSLEKTPSSGSTV